MTANKKKIRKIAGWISLLLIMLLIAALIVIWIKIPCTVIKNLSDYLFHDRRGEISSMIDEAIEDIQAITRDYIGKLKLLAVYEEGQHVLSRKIDSQIQNSMYFIEGLKEHIVRND